ncbi:MAG: TonB family protein [Bacteroidota bacterium]
MIVFERRNYQVAVLFSIILHLSLMLIVFPMQLLSISDGVEEVAVGIYEFVPSEPEVITAASEPEVAIELEKPLPKPVPNRPKPVAQTNQQPKTGQPNQSPNPANMPKGPISLGDGAGMVIGFGQVPNYPKNAENEGVEGQVLVRVLVKMDGTLESAELTKSSGDSRLDKAAVNSLKREWLFKPNTEDYYIEIMFSFADSNVQYKLIKSETRPQGGQEVK